MELSIKIEDHTVVTCIVVLIIILAAIVVAWVCINLPRGAAPTVVPTSVPAMVPTAVPTVVPTAVATVVPTYVSHERIINPVPTEKPRYHPKFLDGTISRINWKDLSGDIPKEDLAYWLGKENSQWPARYREEMYQTILGSQQKYNEIVVIKSGVLQKVVYSTNDGVYLAKDVNVGDYSEEKIVVYSTAFEVDGLNYKMLTGYSQKNNLMVQGYGLSDQIRTEPGYIDQGGDGGVSSASSSSAGSGNSPAPSGPSGPVGGVGG